MKFYQRIGVKMAKKIIRGNLNTKQIIEAEKTVKIKEQAVVNSSSETKEVPGANPLDNSVSGNGLTSGAPSRPNQGTANPQIAGPTPGQIKGPEMSQPAGKTGITPEDEDKIKKEQEQIPNNSVQNPDKKPVDTDGSANPGDKENSTSNQVNTPSTVNKDTTGSTGLNSDNKNLNAAAQKIQDANKTTEELKGIKEKLSSAKLLGGAGCWWTLLAVLIVILIIVIVNFGGTAYNATLGAFGKSTPVPSGKNYESAKKVVASSGKNMKTSGGGTSKYKNIGLTNTDKKAIEDGKIDKRLLDLLNYLSKLHARLAVSHIVDGYTKQTIMESGAERSSQISANVSAHTEGLAMDISEIDYVYRVNEPKEMCQDAYAALCGPLVATCKQTAKELEIGDLVYYSADETQVPADIIPASIKAQSAVNSGQDPTSFAADQATIVANKNVSDILTKIKKSQNILKQMLASFNKSKDVLINERNSLVGLLSNAQGDARQEIQSQINLINQNISKVDTITSKIDGYQNQIDVFSSTTSSLQGSLNGISQAINKYSNLNNLSIDVPVNTGNNVIDGQIQGLISKAKNKISDVTSLSGLASTVNGQIGDLSSKINIANSSITDFSNILDPILNEVDNATSQIENSINSTTSGAINQANIPSTQADLDIINNISNTVNSIGNNPILNTNLSENPFGQLENTAKGMIDSIQGQINSVIGNNISNIANTINTPVNEINGAANTKIDAINQNLSSLVDGLNGLKGNFASQAIADINQVTEESKVFKKLNETIDTTKSVLKTVTTLKNNLSNYVNKVTQLQNSLSTIGNAASTVADLNKITSKVGVDTSSAQNITDQIDKINSAIDTSLNKVNGILSILDQETGKLNNLLGQIQNYQNKPAAEVSKYIDTLIPSLTALESVGHIDILSALNIDLSPLSALQGVIDGYINRLKTEAFEKIQTELENKLKEAVGAELGNVIGSQIPGLSSFGLGGGVENKVLMRMPCAGSKALVTPSDTKLGGNSAVIIPLQVKWQEDSGLSSVTNLYDKGAFFTVLQPETRRKVHELITQTLQFPYDMKNIFYFKPNQIITFSKTRDVDPFWNKLKALYEWPRGENIGLFSMPEALPHVHIAY